MIRVVFFGTPELSVPFLTALAQDDKIDVVLVVTQPDKPSGRKHVLTPSPVKQAAGKLDLRLFQPHSLRSMKTVATIRSCMADVFVVVAYGKIIPTAVLEIPSRGCINVHPSLLPRYRGPSPLSTAIANGDEKTGITIMLLDEGMDTGPILAAKTIPIDDRETLETLTKKILAQGPSLLLDTLKLYVSGKLSAKPQDHVSATVTKLLTREDAHIDWNRPVNEIDRLIRAYQPWPGAWTMWTHLNKLLRLKILTTHPSWQLMSRPPGTAIREADRLLVACADRALEIDVLQLEGGRTMSAKTFLRGYSDVNGAVLA